LIRLSSSAHSTSQSAFLEISWNAEVTSARPSAAFSNFGISSTMAGRVPASVIPSGLSPNCPKSASLGAKKALSPLPLGFAISCAVARPSQSVGSLLVWPSGPACPACQSGHLDIRIELLSSLHMLSFSICSIKSGMIFLLCCSAAMTCSFLRPLPPEAFIIRLVWPHPCTSSTAC
jgi:hypothetical protein